MTASHATTSADGTTIAYEIHGDGEPLVVITGAICHRGFFPVRRGAKILARRFRVYSYDRRGRGGSGDTPPWSLEREVADVEAMIDAAGGRAAIYGHSSGAVLAAHAAHRLGSKVDGVVLYDASWVADAAGAQEYRPLRTDVETLLRQGRRGAAIRRFLTGIGMPAAFARVLPLMPGWRRIAALVPTLRYDLALTADPPPVDVAAQIRIPVHVMVGERSPAELHRVAEILRDAIPGATHEVSPGRTIWPPRNTSSRVWSSTCFATGCRPRPPEPSTPAAGLQSVADRRSSAANTRRHVCSVASGR